MRKRRYLKPSGAFREDERKRTAEEASKWVKMLSKGVLASNAPISSGDTCLRPEWQPVHRRHDLCTGFSAERGNLGRRVGGGLRIRHRGGATRSSEDASVMGAERRGRVILPELWSQPA